MIFTKNNLLQLFSDGGASSGGSNSGTADAGQSSNEGTGAVGQVAPKVVYGLQTENGGSDASSDGTDDISDENGAGKSVKVGSDGSDAKQSEADRRSAYRSFIKENKDLYAEDTQKLINRRFREQRELEEKSQKQEKVLDYLYARYGVEDIDALTKKVESDDSLLTLDNDEYIDTDADSARVRRLQIENNRLSRELKRSADAERARRFNERVASEEREFKKQFPEFSVIDEINANSDFARLLKSGVNVRDAYFAIHHDEITKSALEHAQADAVRRTAENVRARGNRPRENGAGVNPAVVVKNDASALTKADRAEIARRIMRGESISF